MKKLLIMSISAGSALVFGVHGQKIMYPVAPTDGTVDEYFGIAVADPFRPLENDTTAVTLAWGKAENDITRRYLDGIPARGRIRQEMADLLNYEKQGTPWKWRDGRYYLYRNNGQQNQSVLYRRDSLNGPETIVLDPNGLSDDGTVALKGVSMSRDGRHIAYSISRSGSDWTEIYVLDAETLKPEEDHIEWAKFSGATWRGDGFYYSAYDRPEAGKEFSNANANHKIYYHRLGTPQAEDVLIFEDAANPLHFHSADVEGDNDEYLFVHISGQGFGNALKMKDLTKTDSPWVTIEESQDAEISPIAVKDGMIYFLTTDSAPRRRIVKAPVEAPQRQNWTEHIPQAEGVLIDVNRTGDDGLILTYERDASQHPALFSLASGKKLRDIPMPTFGTVGVSSSEHHDDVFYSFTSYSYPSASFRYDKATGESTLFSAPKVKGFNADDYVTEQVFYPSADGTKIPMFITYKKGVKRDGKNPTLLYGYGGFSISLTPSFSTNRLFWLENGGIYAEANLRGGAEYGEEWHEAGTKMKKLNVFNDFIAAAEYLIKEGYTSPDKLAIEGGSNGGLLVGACVNMRPDLFKAAIPQVGVMDMMRYHLFTIGWNWASDYGTSADSPEMAEYLLGYSPVHNVRNDGTPYPAILVTTGDHDDRVVPAHSFKYAAALQASDTGDAPKLIRIESKAGHGAGKPISKILDESADIYAFIFENLGMEY